MKKLAKVILRIIKALIRKFLQLIDILASIFVKILDTIFPFIKNKHFEKYHTQIAAVASQSAFIISPVDTLKEIESFIVSKKKGIYMRFGDGDIYLSIGKNDMMQKANPQLAKEMQEALKIKGEEVLKCMMIHSEKYGIGEYMTLGNHQLTNSYATEIFSLSFPYFVGYKIYSHIALHYCATYHLDLAKTFLKHLKSSTGVFVGNEDVPEQTKNKLFGDIKHIKTPSRNSYESIDIIEKELDKEIFKFNEFKVVCIAMGCSGRALMKRIWLKNYNIFLFDFGSLLDGLSGNQSRTWLKMSQIDYNELIKDL